jgi:hypothetical protein
MMFFQMPKIVGVMLLGSLIAESITLPKFTLPLQYGALGLCAMMVWGVYKILRDQRAEREKMTANAVRERSILVAELQAKDKKVCECVRENTAALEKMTQALGDRPCLAKDSRVKARQG